MGTIDGLGYDCVSEEKGQRISNADLEKDKEQKRQVFMSAITFSDKVFMPRIMLEGKLWSLLLKIGE